MRRGTRCILDQTFSRANSLKRNTFEKRHVMECPRLPLLEVSLCYPVETIAGYGEDCTENSKGTRASDGEVAFVLEGLEAARRRHVPWVRLREWRGEGREYALPVGGKGHCKSKGVRGGEVGEKRSILVMVVRGRRG
jgi:hypothetical protein